MLTPPRLLAGLLLLLAAHGTAHAQNTLILVADDVGVDRVGAYGEHPNPGNTPNLDALAARGVLFRNAWSHPVCSPSRAAILTGRHPFRTGIGSAVRATGDGPGLDLAEDTLPELLGPTFCSVALGKWHLGAVAQGPAHPQDSGFRAYAGALFNLGATGGDYFTWDKTVNGAQGTSTTYATTDTTDDAVRAVRNLPEPWVLYVAYSAAHEPLHAPPQALHSFTLSGVPSNDAVRHIQATIEALDTELGRLLSEVDEETTTVLFVGDNGTTGVGVTAPFDPFRAKGTAYEGGINVPFLVAGRGVTARGAQCNALVHLTDVYATVAELSGAVSLAEDSVSLVPYLSAPALPSLRATVFAEKFLPNGPGPYTTHQRAVRDARFKLIRNVLNGQEELYDLLADPFETTDLLSGTVLPEHAERADRLRRAIADLVSG